MITGFEVGLMTGANITLTVAAIFYASYRIHRIWRREELNMEVKNNGK